MFNLKAVLLWYFLIKPVLTIASFGLLPFLYTHLGLLSAVPEAIGFIAASVN